LCLALSFVTAGCGTFVSQAPPRAEHVFIISIDGGKPSVIAQSQMPELQTLVAEGACTWKATTIFPSITLPAHTSMLTGVGPDKHHILWNEYEPERGFVQVPTVFSEAKRAGFTTAMFVGKQKFRALAPPGTVDEFSYNTNAAMSVLKKMVGKPENVKELTVRAKFVAADAAAYIITNKPNLCFIHFTDTDDDGHKYGWGSPEQIQAFADVDDALNVVMKAIHEAGIADQSVVIVTADHGGHKKTHGSRSPEDMIIPWIAWGKGVKKNFEITDSVNTRDTAATALWLLGIPQPRNIEGKPVTSAF